MKRCDDPLCTRDHRMQGACQRCACCCHNKDQRAFRLYLWPKRRTKKLLDKGAS